MGAIKRRLRGGGLVYHIRNESWIDTKHLIPVKGKWLRQGNEIRFWNILERVADVLIKRMINCLDCGLCTIECFTCRVFDRSSKILRIEGCSQCGECLNLMRCIGWHNRFWRRVIVEGSSI